VIFNLHQKRTNIETRVDQSKAIFWASIHVKNGDGRESFWVGSFLKLTALNLQA
jgi:hypothetical protein